MAAVTATTDRIGEQVAGLSLADRCDPIDAGNRSPSSQPTSEATLPGDPTLWDLVTEEHIAIESLNDAVDAYLADPATGKYRIDDRYCLDLAASVAGYATQREAADLSDAHLPSRRSAVRTALLMARPVRR
jgi:hypothetical protein